MHVQNSALQSDCFREQHLRQPELAEPIPDDVGSTLLDRFSYESLVVANSIAVTDFLYQLVENEMEISPLGNVILNVCWCVQSLLLNN
ncbi:hypothetical protein RCC89_10885 [Cytophagaceae bacterium ABcell3]|nr:hypothetical protein RCC89_10885 [Cytophagaceae bacterium ABcell3]